jgi:hypothetical protein
MTFHALDRATTVIGEFWYRPMLVTSVSSTEATYVLVWCVVFCIWVLMEYRSFPPEICLGTELTMREMWGIRTKGIISLLKTDKSNLMRFITRNEIWNAREGKDFTWSLGSCVIQISCGETYETSQGGHPFSSSDVPHSSNVRNKINLPVKGTISTWNLIPEPHAYVIGNEVCFGYPREENIFPQKFFKP